MRSHCNDSSAPHSHDHNFFVRERKYCVQARFRSLRFHKGVYAPLRFSEEDRYSCILRKPSPPIEVVRFEVCWDDPCTTLCCSVFGLVSRFYYLYCGHISQARYLNHKLRIWETLQSPLWQKFFETLKAFTLFFWSKNQIFKFHAPKILNGLVNDNSG